ncbi:hypothetical protein ACVGVM_24680 [Pseudonocardia bannensis]|uniref:Uncharacterized protein n=1 Tax=Pseudonocardia bannensis TaxID=630973 RepID=A0A848DD00_9PSEU|nr:hypothetical protein [Pseudonocardia bannensis]NMH90465.1 hypothetical protein [Pseudonocardia bannensis]
MNRKPRSTVKGSSTSGRGRWVVENDEFAAFSRRIVRIAGRRVASGDVDALPELAALSAAVDAAITDAVTGLRSAGFSCGEIAPRLGVTRQAAHQRWSATTVGEVA